MINSELEVAAKCDKCDFIIILSKSLSHLDYYCHDCNNKVRVLTVEEYLDEHITLSDRRYLKQLRIAWS